MRASHWTISLDWPRLRSKRCRAEDRGGRFYSLFSSLLGFSFCGPYLGAAVLDEVAGVRDFCRDCCGPCCLATWGAAAVALAEADLVVADLVDLAEEAVDLAGSAAAVRAVAGRVAVGRKAVRSE